MKTLFLAILFFSQLGWSATAELRMGSTKPEQFQFEIKENPMQIGVRHGSVEKILKMPYTVIDAVKINVRLTEKDGKSISQELLFVALTVGNRTQELRVYAPNRSSDVVLSSKIDPVCSIRNEGSFYWESIDDLEKKLRLVEKDKTASLEILVRDSYGQESPKFKASGCAFSLLKK